MRRVALVPEHPLPVRLRPRAARRERVQRPRAAERRPRRCPAGSRAAGREQARALGELAPRRAARPLRHERLPARRARPRTRRCAGRDVPRLVVPELNDPLYGPFEGAHARGVPARGPAGRRRRSRRARAARAGTRSSSATRARSARCSRGPRRRSSSSRTRSRSPTRSRAREGTPPAPRVPLAEYAKPYPFDGAASSSGPRRSSRTWVADADLVIATLSRVDVLDAHRAAHPRARADRARRRGDVPRLRRARLDLPLAARSASSATASRRCTSTTACAAPSPTTTRASAREQLGAEVVRVRPARGDRGRAARAPLRASRPTGSARPGTPRRDQVETILFRLASSGTTKGIKPRREDGVVRPLLPLWREETEALLPRARARVPARLLERATRRAA